MRAVRVTAALAALLCLPGLASAQVQDPVRIIQAFELEVPSPTVELAINGKGEVHFTFHDLSRDSSGGFGVPGTSVVSHPVQFTVQPLEPQTGWQASVEPPNAFTRGGQSVEGVVKFRALGAAQSEIFAVNLTATVDPQPAGPMQQVSAIVSGTTPGIPTFLVTTKGSPELRPRGIADIQLEITNLALFEAVFDVEVMSNPCGLVIVPPQSNFVDQKSTESYLVSVQAPDRKLWYRSEACDATLLVYPQGNQEAGVVAVLSTQVSGFAVYIETVFPIFVAILLLLLVILLLKRRKERLEEEILGKPQKPWTIPVEAVYLRHLKQKDPRAWYVVRHYLMEDEYRSSLLWYKSYKAATKGSRSKERMVLKHERQYERWKAKWAKRIAAPIVAADRKDAKLQRKLDRKAGRANRKALRRHEAKVAKIQKAHDAREEREMEKWEKLSARAAKKGRPAPPKPALAAPDLPKRPGEAAPKLSEHRYGRRAARHRKRMVRRQGNLEVRFEKADARRLRKVKRKVQKVARKLDDPEFVNEHPLLQ